MTPPLVHFVLPGLIGTARLGDSLAGNLDGLVFEPFREGLEICSLHAEPDGGPALALLRYEPGATVPMHEHMGMETIIVLSGSQSDESGHYPAGSVVVNPAGSYHSVASPEGCLVLIHWVKPVRILDED